MILKGCFQLLIIFLVFAGLLYAIYDALNPNGALTGQPEVKLMDQQLLDDLLSISDESIDGLIKLKENNYPSSSEISQEIHKKVSSMENRSLLAVLAQNYLTKSLLAEDVNADGLKGFSPDHCATMCSIIANSDPSREYAMLTACVLRDVRSVSSKGMQEYLSTISKLFHEEYFGSNEFSIAIQELSPDHTITIARSINQISDDGTINPIGVDSGITPVIARNLMTATLTSRSKAENYMISLAESSVDNRTLALRTVFNAWLQSKLQWQIELFDKLLIESDDDVITNFLEQTDYVEKKLGGLMSIFHAEIFQDLPVTTKELLRQKLDQGIVTLFEDQIISDLTSEVSNDTGSSLAYYSDLIDEYPEESEYYIERGKILADEYSDHKRAVNDFSRSISLDKTNPDAYFYRGLSLEQLNDIEGSIADYDSVLYLDPFNTYALGNRAIMKHQIGDYTGAIADYTETLGIDSLYVDAYYGRALSRSYFGDTLGALTDYQKTVGIDSYYYQAYINRALINLELEKDIAALNDYLTVLEIEDNNMDGLYGVAYSYYQMDSLDQSTSYYEKLAEEYPSESGAFYSLGVIYDTRENYQKAYSFLTKTIFMDSTYSEAYLQRGLTSVHLGDTINACLDWVKASNMGESEATGYLRTYCKN